MSCPENRLFGMFHRLVFPIVVATYITSKGLCLDAFPIVASLNFCLNGSAPRSHVPEVRLCQMYWTWTPWGKHRTRKVPHHSWHFDTTWLVRVSSCWQYIAALLASQRSQHRGVNGVMGELHAEVFRLRVKTEYDAPCARCSFHRYPILKFVCHLAQT